MWRVGDGPAQSSGRRFRPVAASAQHPPCRTWVRVPSDRAQTGAGGALTSCRAAEKASRDRLEREQPQRYPSPHVHRNFDRADRWVRRRNRGHHRITTNGEAGRVAYGPPLAHSHRHRCDHRAGDSVCRDPALNSRRHVVADGVLSTAITTTSQSLSRPSRCPYTP